MNDSVGKFCTDNWTVRKRYQLIVQNKLLSTIQAYPLGFLTGDPMPWKRFCLFCLFHASLSIVDCSVQLVYTKFPNRVINRVPTPHHRFARSHADANIGNAPESSQHYSRLLYCYNCRYDATIQDCSPPAAAHQVWSGCGLCRRRRHSPQPPQTPRELP